MVCKKYSKFVEYRQLAKGAGGRGEATLIQTNKVTCEVGRRFAKSAYAKENINLLAPEFFFILAHPVYKM